MFIGNGFGDRLKLILPKVSLIPMTLQVIEHPLLAPIEAHRATVRGRFGNSTAILAPKPALQLSAVFG
jgi:hypothetical protein